MGTGPRAVTLNLSPKDAALATTFITLLGSDQDGEVANAARMLGRLLRRNRKDFHDLAKLVMMSRKATPPLKWTRPPKWTPPSDWTWTDKEDGEKPKQPAEPPEVKTMKRTDQLAWCRLCMERLTLERHDEAVVPDMAARLTSYSYYLNKEQLKVLNRIVRRAWRLGLRI